MPRPIIMIQANIIVKIAQCEAEDKATSTMSAVANILANDAANEADPQKACDLQADAATATAQAAQHTANAQQLFDEAVRLKGELATAEEAEEIAQAIANLGNAPVPSGPARLFKKIIELDMTGILLKRQRPLPAE